MPDSSTTTDVENIITAEIPSWPKLFNIGTQCECDECETMTGFPHFVASTCHFLEQCTKNDVGESPYDVLIKRAPYIPHTLLTCENSNKVMRYIQRGLEILQFYVAKKSYADLPAYDSKSDDWLSDYNAVARQAYKFISQAFFPFGLPYHQPLAVARTFLEKQGTSLDEMLKVFGVDDSAGKLRILKEKLQLSEEEYLLLTAFKTDAGVQDVFSLYGFDTDANFQAAIYKLEEFLHRTGLLPAEIVDILQTRFINPGVELVKFIETVFRDAGVAGSTLWSQLKDIKSKPFDATLTTTIQNFLKPSNQPALDPQLLKNWIDAGFDDFSNVVIIIPDKDDACDLRLATLGTIKSTNDNTVKPPITNDQFKKLYFFTRLLRKTGLTISELDDLVSPVATKTNDVIVQTLAAALIVKEKLSLANGQVPAIYGQLPFSLYSQLFLNRALNSINADFKPDATGNFFAKATPLKTAAGYHPVLSLVFQLNASQFDLLIKITGIAPGANLSMEVVSVLYSYVLVAAAAGINFTDFLSLIQYSKATTGLRTWDKTANKFSDADLNSALSFLRLLEKLSSSAFTFPDLLYVLGSPDNVSVTARLSNDAVKQSILNLKTSFTTIDVQNPTTPADLDLNVPFLKSKLVYLYDKNKVALLAGMLDGTIIYGVTLAQGAVLNIPADTTLKINYTQATGRLEVTGAITQKQWDAITDAGLKTALQPIFDKPFNDLKGNFGDILTADVDRNKLLDRDATVLDIPGKVSLVYSQLQPKLVKQLKYGSLIKEIAGFISLDANVSALITRKSIDAIFKTVDSIVGLTLPDGSDVPDMTAYTTALANTAKAGLFINNFNLNYDEVNYFISGIDFTNVTMDQWLSIYYYTQLRNFNQSTQFDFIDLFKKASVAGVKIEEVVGQLVMTTGWRMEDVMAIISSGGIKTDDFKNAVVPYKMSQQMQLVNKTGIRATHLLAWTNAPTDFDSLFDIASAIRENFLSRYDETARNDMEASASEILYENERDAFAAYILTFKEMKDRKITTVDDLSRFFCFEILMRSVMPVTRLRFLMNVILSFVFQVHEGMESAIDATTGKQVGVLPHYIDPEIWKTKSLFRLWQVSMELLTNPYPYLSYKYIVDKPEFAKAFEENLLKSDATAEAINDFYAEAVEDFIEPMNNEIVCTYIDDADKDNDPATKVIHVIGKTRSVPHKYFHRVKDEQDRWSFWRTLPFAVKENDADFNGVSGAHIILIRPKTSSSLFAFMAEFVPRQLQPDPSSKTPTQLSTQAVNAETVQSFWEVKLAVSEFSQNRWSEKKYLKPDKDLSVFININAPDVSGYFFTTSMGNAADQTETLILIMHSLNEEGRAVDHLRFTFTSIRSGVVIDSLQPTGRTRLILSDIIRSKTGVTPDAVRNNYKIFFQNIKLDDEMVIPLSDTEKTPVILKSDQEMLINFSPQFSVDLKSIYSQPFFFHDKDRSYYTVSEDSKFVAIDPNPPNTLKVNAAVMYQPGIINTIRHPDTTMYMPFHID